MGDFNADPVIKHSNGSWKSITFIMILMLNLALNYQMDDALTFFYKKKHPFIKANVFETALSDHHLLIYNIHRTQYINLPPKLINYRCYKKFNPEICINKLYYNLQYLPSDNSDSS